MREILFENAIITVRSFNIIIALGFVFTGIYLVRYVAKHKMNLEFLTSHAVPVLLVAGLAGRLSYFLENLSEFFSRPLSLLLIWDLKFSFFGILAGGLFAIFYFSRKYQEDFWDWLDAFSLSILVMLIFVHLGDFFAGNNYGLPTDLPWGVSFDTIHIPFVSPIHPTQLYAMLFSIILLIYSNKKGRRIHLSGVVGTKAIMIYSLGMLGIDFLHGAPSFNHKIAYGLLAAVSFIGYIQCTHKTHITNQE